MTANMISYQQTQEHFALTVPAAFNFSRDVIDAHRGLQTPAIRWLHADAETIVSYQQLSLTSIRIASALQQLGVSKGDTVIVMLGRKLQWWEVVAACLRMGAVISPATPQLSAPDLEYRINAANARCVITHADHRAKIDAIEHNCPGLSVKILVGADAAGWTSYPTLLTAGLSEHATADTLASDEAFCFFTSGTTGKPKMTVHTQASYGIAHTTTGRFWLDQKPGDLHWNIADTGWAKAAWSSFFGPLICGSCVFVDDADFNPRRTLDLVQRYPITTMCGAPTIYRMLVQQDLSGMDKTSLRHCVAAGEPLNPEVIELWRDATGITVRDGYGQTETVLLCGNFLCMDTKAGSMGKPAPGFDLAVIDDAGAVVAPNIEGDIAVRVRPQRPVGLFKEYRNAPAATAACFRGDWYITGDRAYTDEDGYFWFVGRADDVIITAGYRIGPFEVESTLLEHAAVAESAVVSSPDPTRGEIVKAFVVLSAGFEPSDALCAELQQHVKSSTAPYKYPRKIEFVASLPKTVSGKIRRKELRDREWQKVI
jgi:acetyl-CoA synthetase/medium-chain acyl-CoA synthetase